MSNDSFKGSPTEVKLSVVNKSPINILWTYEFLQPEVMLYNWGLNLKCEQDVKPEVAPWSVKLEKMEHVRPARGVLEG